MGTSLPSSPAVGGAGSQSYPQGERLVDALQLQGKLDVPQAGKQGLHVLSLSQLGFGESVDPHLQLEGNTSASA